MTAFLAVFPALGRGAMLSMLFVPSLDWFTAS